MVQSCHFLTESAVISTATQSRCIHFSHGVYQLELSTLVIYAEDLYWDVQFLSMKAPNQTKLKVPDSFTYRRIPFTPSISTYLYMKYAFIITIFHESNSKIASNFYTLF